MPAIRPVHMCKPVPLTVLLVLLCVLLMTAEGFAEIDPVRRNNLEFAFEGPLRGNGPLGGVGFLLINRPHFPTKDTYLMTVISPYLYTEITRDKLPAEGHALGLGIGGGFLANDFEQVRNGSYKRQESFRGNGADAALSYYLRPSPIGGVLPVDGIVRATTRYADYLKGADTESAYKLPADTFIHGARVGVRIGGIPPELLPEKALELSLWYEADYRVKTGLHGLPGRQQETEHLTQQAWGRLGGTMPVWSRHSASLMMSGGISGRTDELSCYRMGSGLRFQDEFPYVIHGYYSREIFARSFFLLNTSYRFPPVPDLQHLQLQFSYDYARVGYQPGHELPHNSLNGLGADIILFLPKEMTLTLGYGYGIDASRHGGFGGQQLNIMYEWKL